MQPARNGDKCGRAARCLHRGAARPARWSEARACYTAALDESRKLGSKHWEAIAWTGLGDVAWMSGEHETARRPYEQAIATYRALGLARDEANISRQLASLLHALNDDDGAFELSDRALAELARIDDRHGQSRALVARGSMHADRYKWDEAIAAYDRALALWPERELVHRAPIIAGQANLLENLGGTVG